MRLATYKKTACILQHALPASQICATSHLFKEEVHQRRGTGKLFIALCMPPVILTLLLRFGP